MGCIPEVGILKHAVCPATPRDTNGLPPEGMLSGKNARAISQHPQPAQPPYQQVRGNPFGPIIEMVTHYRPLIPPWPQRQ